MQNYCIFFAYIHIVKNKKRIFVLNIYLFIFKYLGLPYTLDMGRRQTNERKRKNNLHKQSSSIKSGKRKVSKHTVVALC